MSILKLLAMKKEEQPISMVTCYDAWSAKILAKSSVDCVLVGDSVSMVVHGFDSTLSATVDMMSNHVAAVTRGLGASTEKVLVGDMPFMSFRKGKKEAMRAAEQIMRAGAHAVKLEGVWGHEKIISHLVGSGIPVQGHIGLTPQSIHALGGYKVQGRHEDQREDLIKQAEQLEELGCFSVVLECVPKELSRLISSSLNIPTIGIGAGPYCDGQVLVMQDMLGLNGEFKPKFLKTYLEGGQKYLEAFNDFDKEVKAHHFPSDKESYQ
ncbi:3-methyl-2-oxobutanoate hydroxymethyltransferase [bacterium]|nr:3-methyl-2-oxobutanoate hydroxymethyltransferase [bacterium]